MPFKDRIQFNIIPMDEGREQQREIPPEERKRLAALLESERSRLVAQIPEVSYGGILRAYIPNEMMFLLAAVVAAGPLYIYFTERDSFIAYTSVYLGALFVAFFFYLVYLLLKSRRLYLLLRKGVCAPAVILDCLCISSPYSKAGGRYRLEYGILLGKDLERVTVYNRRGAIDGSFGAVLYFPDRLKSLWWICGDWKKNLP